jgi:predicted Zn-dependent protease
MPGRSWRTLKIALCLLAVMGAGSAQSDSLDYQTWPLDDDEEILTDAVEVGQLFEERGLIFRHEDLEDLLGVVAGRLRLPAPDTYIDYRLYLIDDPSPHAFSLVDGQVYLHTGLVARLESLDELAAIVAHEAHHVAAHHHVAAERDKSGGEKGRNLGLYVLDAAGLGGAATTFSSAAAMRSRGKFDLEYEIDADHKAAVILAKAGISSAAISQLLGRIANEANLVAATMPGVFAAGGEITERRDRFDALEQAQPGGAAVFDDVDVARFHEIASELRRKTIADYIRANAPRMASVYARQLIEADGDAAAYAALGDALYALGPHADSPPPPPSAKEVRRLSKMTRAEIDAELLATEEGQANQQRHWAEAMEAYTRALEIDPGFATAHRGAGRVLYAEGRYREAGASLLRYLKLRPKAVDRPIVMEKLRAIRNALNDIEENAS